jgi:anthranilate 1,2-dioxygenase ferredoxin subunit
MSEWHNVTKLENLQHGEILAHSLGDLDLILIREGDQVTCFLDQCGHQPLKLSEFGDILHGNIHCNAHGAKFDCQTGEVTCGPALTALRHFPTKVEQGDVFVLIEE